MSTLEICESLDFPVPQGSIRYLDASSTARIPPRRSALGWSIEVDIKTQAPFGRSERQDLEKNIIIYDPRHENTCFLRMRKQSADELHGNRAADLHLCFCYRGRTILLVSIYKVSSL